MLKLFGMYAAIAFAVIGVGRLWGERRWWLLAAVAVDTVLRVKRKV